MNVNRWDIALIILVALVHTGPTVVAKLSSMELEIYIITFLAATKQLYKWYFPSVCLSHLFDYVPIIVSSWNFQELLPMTKVRSMQKVKVKGQSHRGHNPT